ncbi:hypothetical protein CBR_g55778 [Chara braunii]|uniref:Uncharacterized protein n=1 Tax=Chara braunii TaxID=69332 RepID=A0A388MDD2_CHABU|nr:hypothetical protein CBR_g55778 [Chara braunii]|eukprot:GBG92505.1 hypothetical protein CBR_g55778 [Chara braunii]
MSGGIGDSSGKVLTLDDLIEAMDKRERTPSNVPKVDTFHFKGEQVSDWLDLVEQALVGLTDTVKFQRIMRYVLHGHHQEVQKVVDDANDNWAKFREGMQRNYRLGDGLLTTADLEAMNKDDFTTIGAFLQEFKKRVRKVHGILEEAQCAIFLGLLTASEASELTSHGGGNAKLTWAAIDKGVEDESLDQVEQHQVITCRNTGPRSLRNRTNPDSFTIEESEEEHQRLTAEPEEEVGGEAFSLSLSDVNKVMDIVVTHEMADPDAIQALREQGSCRINEENEGKLIVGEPDFLLPRERTLMVELIKKRHRAYAFNDEERSRLDVDKISMIRIHTVPHEPWNLRGTRYPDPDEEKKVVDYLDGKIRMHVADYSSGPYASPWFYFIKPNGTLRWVQDLQRLNVVTVRDAGGLPNADALSESCVGRPIISLIDLYSEYDQFPVYPPDQPVTAIHTPRGLIHMNVAPQRWTNAVAMVQRHMIRVMQTVSPHITQPYIDDLAIKGPRRREDDEVLPGVRRFVWKHVQDLDKVLGLLKEYNLTASGAKSKHCMREVTILGFVCNESGRRPDVKKTDKIVGNPRRVICRRNREIDVIVALHDGIAGGHRGIAATYAKISELYYWDGMMEMVVEFHRFTGGGLGGSPQHTQEKVPASGGPLQELEAHLDVTQWRVPPMSERHVEPVEAVPRGKVSSPEQEKGPSAGEGGAEDEVIEVEEDTPPQTPGVGLRLESPSEGAPSRGEESQKEGVIPALPETVPFPEEMEEGETERFSLRREADTLIDNHLAARALELPDLEEPMPVELPQEPCQSEREVGAEVPEETDRRTVERVHAGKTAEEKRGRMERRWEEIGQERQRLKEAGALPDPPPPYRLYGLKEIWEEFLEQYGKSLTAQDRAEIETSRKADEYLDWRIRSQSKTSFDRYMMLEEDLRGKELRETGIEARLEAVEAEVRELRVMVTSQAVIIQDLRQQCRGGVDGAKSSWEGEQRQSGSGVPEQPPATDPRQEAPMGRVILEPEEAKAKREAKREAFEFRAPTELAMLPTVTVDPTMPPSVEEGLPAASGEPVQGSTGGSMEALLEAVHTMQAGTSLFSPEPRIEEPPESEMGGAMEGIIEGRPQRLDTPEYMPEEVGTRSGPSPRELETGPEEPMDRPQSYELERDVGKAPSSPGPQ